MHEVYGQEKTELCAPTYHTKNKWLHYVGYLRIYLKVVEAEEGAHQRELQEKRWGQQIEGHEAESDNLETKHLEPAPNSLFALIHALDSNSCHDRVLF